jgi:hypothetical protein
VEKRVNINFLNTVSDSLEALAHLCHAFPEEAPKDEYCFLHLFGRKMICTIKDFCFNGTIRQARNAARILIFSNEIEECKRIIKVSHIIENKEIMSNLSGETNRLVSRFAALNQFAKHLFRECEPYIQEITKVLFGILARKDEQESAKECHEWSDFLALCPEGKVKALSIKILANGVKGTKSTGTLFYSFLQFFERMVDSDGEYTNEGSTL